MTIFAEFLGYPDLISWLQGWLPIIFMGLLVVGLFSVKRMMPRTRPKEIKPDTAPVIAWADIAGADEAKDELREVVDYLRNPKRFHAIGARVPRGVLLYGPPGTGKTLLAKAVAHESGAVFFSQSAASFVEMFVGVGSARIRELFRSARKRAPAIVPTAQRGARSRCTAASVIRTASAASRRFNALGGIRRYPAPGRSR